MPIIDVNIEDYFASWETHLDIDAMYFHAACQAYERAQSCTESIKSSEKRWSSLNDSYDKILSKYGGDIHSACDDLEPIGIQLESAHSGIELAYAPLLKEVATVHILSVASLEAHINSVAKEVLQGKEFDHFESLRISTKWLFLPKITGLSGFDPGQQPFQAFSRLLKFRNKLVHFKGLKEKWTYGAVPQFIKDLGLTIEDSLNSVESVKAMIGGLSLQREIELPFWLGQDPKNSIYFKLVTK